MNVTSMVSTPAHLRFMTEGMEWSRLALSLSRSGLHEAAGGFYEQLLNLKIECFGRTDFRTCWTLADLGGSLCSQGFPGKGKALLQEAIDVLHAQGHTDEEATRKQMAKVLQRESAPLEEGSKKAICNFSFCRKRPRSGAERAAWCITVGLNAKKPTGRD